MWFSIMSALLTTLMHISSGTKLHKHIKSVYRFALAYQSPYRKLFDMFSRWYIKAIISFMYPFLRRKYLIDKSSWIDDSHSPLLLLFCFCNFQVSAILGVSWIWGFLAGFLNMEVFWWIFVILNAYQGVLIFLSYGVAKRSRQLWQEHLKKWRTSW